jgi:hypothetical protein
MAVTGRPIAGGLHRGAKRFSQKNAGAAAAPMPSLASPDEQSVPLRQGGFGSEVAVDETLRRERRQICRSVAIAVRARRHRAS